MISWKSIVFFIVLFFLEIQRRYGIDGLALTRQLFSITLSISIKYTTESSINSNRVDISRQIGRNEGARTGKCRKHVSKHCSDSGSHRKNQLTPRFSGNEINPFANVSDVYGIKVELSSLFIVSLEICNDGEEKREINCNVLWNDIMWSAPPCFFEPF